MSIVVPSLKLLPCMNFNAFKHQQQQYRSSSSPYLTLGGLKERKRRLPLYIDLNFKCSTHTHTKTASSNHPPTARDFHYYCTHMQSNLSSTFRPATHELSSRKAICQYYAWVCVIHNKFPSCIPYECHFDSIYVRLPFSPPLTFSLPLVQ